MRELPDLRHPALAARGRHPILTVYVGASRRLSRTPMTARIVRHVACPAVVVP